MLRRILLLITSVFLFLAAVTTPRTAQAASCSCSSCRLRPAQFCSPVGTCSDFLRLYCWSR